MFKTAVNMARATTILLVICVWCEAHVAWGGIVARLEQGERLTIVAIGTSLTATTPWFSQMGAWLKERYPGKAVLFNEGVSGSASKYTPTYRGPASGLDVQLSKALAHAPDAVFIEFAVNDAYAPYGISQEASKDNLRTMIGRINGWAALKHKKVDIVVQTMNNVLEGSEHATSRPKLAEYTQGYREVAAAKGVLLIDHYRNWVDLYGSQPDHAAWSRYVPDGIHPNALGAERVIVPEIRRVLNGQKTPERASLVLLAAGVLGLSAYVWRKRKQANGCPRKARRTQRSFLCVPSRPSWM